MRSIIAFDTLAFVKELKESGMEAKEAEGIAKALMIALGQLIETKELATRQDIFELRQEMHTNKVELDQKITYIHSELKEQIHDGRGEFRASFKDQELQLKGFIIKCFTGLVTILGTIEVLMKFFGK
jgi:hypothetical protein